MSVGEEVEFPTCARLLCLYSEDYSYKRAHDVKIIPRTATLGGSRERWPRINIILPGARELDRTCSLPAAIASLMTQEYTSFSADEGACTRMLQYQEETLISRRKIDRYKPGCGSFSVTADSCPNAPPLLQRHVKSRRLISRLRLLRNIQGNGEQT